MRMMTRRRIKKTLRTSIPLNTNMMMRRRLKDPGISPIMSHSPFHRTGTAIAFKVRFFRLEVKDLFNLLMMLSDALN